MIQTTNNFVQEVKISYNGVRSTNPHQLICDSSERLFDEETIELITKLKKYRIELSMEDIETNYKYLHLVKDYVEEYEFLLKQIKEFEANGIRVHYDEDSFDIDGLRLAVEEAMEDMNIIHGRFISYYSTGGQASMEDLYA